MSSKWSGVLILMASGIVHAQPGITVTPPPPEYRDTDADHAKFRQDAVAYFVQALLPLCPQSDPKRFCVQDDKHSPIAVWVKDDKTLMVHVLMQGLDYATSAELDSAVGKLGRQFAATHNKNFIVRCSVTNGRSGYGAPTLNAGISKSTLDLFVPDKLPDDAVGTKVFLRK